MAGIASRYECWISRHPMSYGALPNDLGAAKPTMDESQILLHMLDLGFSNLALECQRSLALSRAIRGTSRRARFVGRACLALTLSISMFESASTSIADGESTMIDCKDLVFSSSSCCWIRLNTIFIFQSLLDLTQRNHQFLSRLNGLEG